MNRRAIFGVVALAVIGGLGLGACGKGALPLPNWSETIEAVSENEAYDGIRLVPQKGLVPLGPDPDSGLYEFAVEGTGVIPKRDAETGRLVLIDRFAIIMILIPGGTFWMGAQSKDRDGPNYDPGAQSDEGDQQGLSVEVTLSPFYLAKHEVTQAQWERLSGESPSGFKPGDHEGVTLRNAVECLSWYDCRQALALHALRLPTEAEWEYACRAKAKTRYWSGTEEEDLARVGWYQANSGLSTHAVGEKPANAFGLHDVHGNVWEWCLDAYAPYAEGPQTDPVVKVGPNRVYRGGSWLSTAEFARSASRNWYDPRSRHSNLGVRPARPIVLGVASCGDDEAEAVVATSPPPWPELSTEQRDEAERLGVPVKFENDLGMRFVLIPSGEFLMGSLGYEAGRFDDEVPQHLVTFAKPFYMQITEVTNAQYRRFRADHGYEGGFVTVFDGDDQPVVNVSRSATVAFASWLSEREEGPVYRLPSEAEWEYACRAGTTTRYWSGDAEVDLDRVGWFGGNSGDPEASWDSSWLDPDDKILQQLAERGCRSHPVGRKPACPWGLYDMHGNVREYCADTWHDTYEGAPTDGSAWTTPVVAPGNRIGDPIPHWEEGKIWPVLRGGDWTFPEWAATSTRRAYCPPSYWGGRFLGFRLVSPVPVEGE